jgi:hypothetical protein
LLLLDNGVTHVTHSVFPNHDRLIVVDFFLSDRSTIIECWKTTARRGAAFIDVKFKRLKALRPGIRCVALAEAPHEEREALSGILKEILMHADRVALRIDDLRTIIADGEAS